MHPLNILSQASLHWLPPWFSPFRRHRHKSPGSHADDHRQCGCACRSRRGLVATGVVTGARPPRLRSRRTAPHWPRCSGDRLPRGRCQGSTDARALARGPLLSPRQAQRGRPAAHHLHRREQLTVRVRDLAKLGDLLDKVTAAGANRIDGIEVHYLQPGRTARGRAASGRRRQGQADLYAKAAGFTLGKVMSFTEESVPSPPVDGARHGGDRGGTRADRGRRDDAVGKGAGSLESGGLSAACARQCHHHHGRSAPSCYNSSCGPGRLAFG